jgi:radical SAM/Cys-rich protein
VPTVDIGGAGIEPHFRYLVSATRALGIRVLDRCNLTILEQPGQDDLADFLAANRVGVVASMPCYLEDNVDRQRGDGVFQASVRALRKLNAVGYGRPGSELTLDLVYNPQGPSLPPGQAQLEQDYKHYLRDNYGIEFDRLHSQCPSSAWQHADSKGQFSAYPSFGHHHADNPTGRAAPTVGITATFTTAISTRCWACRCVWAKGRGLSSQT